MHKRRRSPSQSPDCRRVKQREEEAQSDLPLLHGPLLLITASYLQFNERIWFHDVLTEAGMLIPQLNDECTRFKAFNIVLKNCIDTTGWGYRRHAHAILRKSLVYLLSPQCMINIMLTSKSMRDLVKNSELYAQEKRLYDFWE